MSVTVNMSQSLAVVGQITPGTATAGTPIFTDVVDMSLYSRALFVVSAGTILSTGTVDFAIYGCATSGGSYTAIDLTNCAITQLSSANSNVIDLLELRAEYVNSTGFRYFKGKLTPTTANSTVSVVVLATCGRNKPESAGNIAAVKQIVVY